MSRLNIPASVLAQRGKPVKLIDDTTRTVIFTFSSLMRIEEDFGSVVGALVAIKQGTAGQAFTSIAQIMSAGLEHEQLEDGSRLSDPEVLRGQLDPSLFDDYSEALGEAIEAAFPAAKEGEGQDDADPQPGSRGESGTTSPSSRSDDLTPNSGA